MMRQDRFTEQAQEVLQASQEMVRQHRHAQWDVEHVFLAALTHKDGLARRIFEKLGVDVDLLREAGVDKERLYRALQEVRGGARVQSRTAESHYQALEKYSVDLTEMARQGKLDPVIGPEAE